MPKPYPGADLCTLLVFREESVQDARVKVSKCAGCSDQVGTKIRTGFSALPPPAGDEAQQMAAARIVGGQDLRRPERVKGGVQVENGGTFS